MMTILLFLSCGLYFNMINIFLLQEIHISKFFQCCMLLYGLVATTAYIRIFLFAMIHSFNGPQQCPIGRVSSRRSVVVHIFISSRVNNNNYRFFG